MTEKEKIFIKEQTDRETKSDIELQKFADAFFAEVIKLEELKR